MKISINYSCEKCGREFLSSMDCEAHEAFHLGLTLEEYQAYKMLQEIVTRRSYEVSVTKNSKTEEEFDRAIKELMNFENKHKILVTVKDFYKYGGIKDV